MQLEPLGKCDIVFDGTDSHKGEDWYRCNTCGWRDWFAYSRDPYGTQPCTNTHYREAIERRRMQEAKWKAEEEERMRVESHAIWMRELLKTTPYDILLKALNKANLTSER